MIRTVTRPEGLVLEADLTPGWRAYLDTDWIALADDVVPALLVDPDEVLHWPGTDPRETPADMSADTSAALALIATAAQALETVGAVSPDRIAINGRGLLANYARSLLPQKDGEVADTPRVVVEMTGEPQQIVSAASGLSDLGILVLAGPPHERPVTIDLYPDVHVRGIMLVGAPWPLSDPWPPVRAVPEWVRTSRADVEAGAPLPPDAAWVRITGEQRLGVREPPTERKGKTWNDPRFRSRRSGPATWFSC